MCHVKMVWAPLPPVVSGLEYSNSELMLILILVLELIERGNKITGWVWLFSSP